MIELLMNCWHCLWIWGQQRQLCCLEEPLQHAADSSQKPASVMLRQWMIHLSNGVAWHPSAASTVAVMHTTCRTASSHLIRCHLTLADMEDSSVFLLCIKAAGCNMLPMSVLLPTQSDAHQGMSPGEGSDAAVMPQSPAELIVVCVVQV
jgi:hypothetical protein